MERLNLQFLEGSVEERNDEVYSRILRAGGLREFA